MPQTPITFQATLRDAGGGGCYIEVPFDPKATFGKARVPILAMLDGEPYRGSIMPYAGRNMIGVLKAIREKIGKGPGEVITVTVQEDTTPRTVEVPEDLRAALDAQPEAGAAFQKLSYTHQREHVQALLDAKKPETRQRRIEKTLEMLLAKGRKA